jgi:hypothetical protein
MMMHANSTDNHSRWHEPRRPIRNEALDQIRFQLAIIMHGKTPPRMIGFARQPES